MDVVLIDDEVGYDVLGAMLIKNGPEEERQNAEIFIDWLMSEQGQECLIPSVRVPVNTNAKMDDSLIDLSMIKTINFDPVWSGENRERLIETFAEDVDNASNVKE